MKPWTYEECKRRIKKLRDRFEGEKGLHERIAFRDGHYYNRPEVDPVMGADWQHAKMQTTILRDTHMKFRARMLENAWKPEMSAGSDTPTGQATANEAEWLISQGFAELADKTGVDIQGELVDGMKTCVGVLHWEVLDYEDAPDYEETDDVPEGQEKRYTTDDYADERRSKTKKHRETDDSLQERIAQKRAKQGFPVMWETIPPEQCYWEEDKSVVSQFKSFLVRRTVATLADYAEMIGGSREAGLPTYDELKEQADAPVAPRDSPQQSWQPSASDWGETVTLEQYWTRTHVYELCEWAGGGPEKSYFRAMSHPYKMPTFALAIASYTKNSDPALAYEPYLESLYRLKPAYDRFRALYNALAEASAVPVWYLVNTKTGATKLNDKGMPELLMGESAASAMTIPEGWDLKRFGGEGVSGTFDKAVDNLWAEVERATPPTGNAQFAPTTQPWSARIEQAQENMQPKMYLKAVERCIKAALNNVVDVFASEDGPGEVFGYRMDGDRLDRTKVISLKREQWEGLTADVSINPISSVERITAIEHGVVLLEKGLITELEFIGDYEGKPNPEKVRAQRKVFQYYATQVEPGLLQQAYAKWAGARYAQAPDGTFVGPDGKVVDPSQAVAGYDPAVVAAVQTIVSSLMPQAPPQNGQVPQGGGGPPQAPQQGTPALPALSAPNTMPLAGMRG